MPEPVHPSNTLEMRSTALALVRATIDQDAEAAAVLLDSIDPADGQTLLLAVAAVGAELLLATTGDKWRDIMDGCAFELARHR